MTLAREELRRSIHSGLQLPKLEDEVVKSKNNLIECRHQRFMLLVRCTSFALGLTRENPA